MQVRSPKETALLLHAASIISMRLNRRCQASTKPARVFSNTDA